MRVGPSQPIMPDGMSARLLFGSAASTMEASPISAWRSVIMEPMRDGTALMSSQPVQVSRPAMRDTVLRNWTAAIFVDILDLDGR